MESQPQNSEFTINPENFHPCINGYSCFTYYVQEDLASIYSGQQVSNMVL